MGTTADKLNRLIGTKQAIREAIVSKGVSVSKDDTFSSYAGKIREIPQEGGGADIVVPQSDVNFYDYDGKLLHAYTSEDFLALSELPALPSRTGLICQEWNWTLEDAKAYVEEYGKCDIGATYITDDGKTRLYIKIAADGRMNVPLRINQTVAHGVKIDWGDGSAEETISGTGFVNFTHHYDKIGDYVITLEVAEGCILDFGGFSGSENYVYANMFQKIEIGQRVTVIGASAFGYCYSLASVVIPNSVTRIENSAFGYCYSLASVVIPNSVTRMEAHAFYYCYSLASVVIPNSVTAIESDAFGYCYSLASVVIPNSVTAIRNLTFQYCHSLASVVIPNSVTAIEGDAFGYCYSLASAVIPNSVTAISADAFKYCYGVAYYDFTQCTSIPALGTGAFTNIVSDCKIIVPYQLYSDWIAASVWSTYADYIIMNYTPEECLSLEITAEDVMYGNFDTAKIHWTAVTNGVTLDGTRVENITLTRSEDVNIGLNKTSESLTKEVSYTYMGVTATTTVTQGSYLENCMVCKYNATSTTSATTLMYSSFSNYSTYFTSMIVDGVETTLARTYKFPTLGEHTVIFKVADGVSITTPYRMFYNCTALTYVDCTELNLSAATSTSSSSGTAYMFYGCTNLQTIILPDTINYLGYYMFYNCLRVTSLTIKAHTAPTVYSSSTWGTTTYYLGYNNRNQGTNKFYVPIGATGYVETSYWARLYDASYCGFTKEEVENL